jgi:hypothetical protein
VRADYARTSSAPVPVTRYRARVTYVRHVGPGEDELTYAECDHEHRAPEGAERCARQLARRYTGDVR